MRTIGAMALIAALGWCVGCGGVAGGAAGEKRGIDVNGIGEVEVTPDMLSVHLGVETVDNNPVKAQAENDRRVRALLDITKKLEIPPADVDTGDVSLARHEEWEYRKPMFLGYFARTDIAVTLRDMSKYGRLVTEALEAGVNNISSLEYDYSKGDEKAKEAQILAVRAARQKAVALAAELGKKIGQPLHISNEESGRSYGERRTQNFVQDVAEKGFALAPGRLYYVSTSPPCTSHSN